MADVTPGITGASFMRADVSADEKIFGPAGCVMTGVGFVEVNPASICSADNSFQFSRVAYFETIALNDARFLFNFETSDPYAYSASENFLCAGFRNFAATDDRRDFLTGEKTGTFSEGGKSLYLSYGFEIYGARAGITGKSISENIDDFQSSEPAFDAGFIKNADDEYPFALSVRNIGGHISGSPLPFTVTAAAAMKEDSFTIAAGAEKTREEPFVYSAAAETQNGIMSLRLGLRLADSVEPAAGFGISWNKFIFGYTFSYHRYLGPNHFFTVTMNL